MSHHEPPRDAAQALPSCSLAVPVFGPGSVLVISGESLRDADGREQLVAVFPPGTPLATGQGTADVVVTGWRQAQWRVDRAALPDMSDVVQTWELVRDAPPDLWFVPRLSAVLMWVAGSPPEVAPWAADILDEQIESARSCGTRDERRQLAAELAGCVDSDPPGLLRHLAEEDRRFVRRRIEDQAILLTSDREVLTRLTSSTPVPPADTAMLGPPALRARGEQHGTPAAPAARRPI